MTLVSYDSTHKNNLSPLNSFVPYLKSVFSISLVLVLMLQSLTQLGFLAYYTLNADSIEAQYCVNKDKPDMCCKGKCYISKQLNQSSSSEAPASKTNTEQAAPDFIVTDPHSISFNNALVSILFPVYRHAIGTDYVSAQYRPPRCI